MSESFVPSKYWIARTGGRLSRYETADIDAAGQLDSVQICWAIALYVSSMLSEAQDKAFRVSGRFDAARTSYLRASDFLQWLGVDISGIPEPAVCYALLSSYAPLRKLAQRYQWLQSLWFPSYEQTSEMNSALRMLQNAYDQSGVGSTSSRRNTRS